MPWDEVCGRVVVCLGKGVSESGLGGEIHVAEEELADEVCGDGRGFTSILCFGDNFLDAPVEKADGKGTKMVVWGEKGGGLWRECSRRSFRLGEGCGVMFVCDEGIQSGEGVGFASAMGGGGGFEAHFGHCGDGEGVIRAGKGVVRLFFIVSLDAVDVGMLRWLSLLEVEGQITRIW